MGVVRSQVPAEEQETTVRWKRAGGPVTLWTSSAVERRRWVRLGYRVERDGVGWRTEGPAGCVRVRKVRDGELVGRRGRVPVIRPSGVPPVPDWAAELLSKVGG